MEDETKNVFERLHAGEHVDIRDGDYQREVHGEIDRCDHVCWQINTCDPADREEVLRLENELLHDQMHDGTFITPPLHIDCANQVTLGKNVYINHDLDVMSLGGVTIEDGVMIGPEVGFFTVNHEAGNIRTVMTKGIHIKKNAWVGARVSILPGVTIGENAIVGTGAVVTKDVPDNAIAVGNPAHVIRTIER